MSDLKKINIMGGDYEFTLDITGPMNDYDFNYIPSDLPDIYKKILSQKQTLKLLLKYITNY